MFLRTETDFLECNIQLYTHREYINSHNRVYTYLS